VELNLFYKLVLQFGGFVFADFQFNGDKLAVFAN
jgi:hypothetical protein